MEQWNHESIHVLPQVTGCLCFNNNVFKTDKPPPNGVLITFDLLIALECRMQDEGGPDYQVM
jgi:hypothetical protein